MARNFEILLSTVNKRGRYFYAIIIIKKKVFFYDDINFLKFYDIYIIFITILISNDTGSIPRHRTEAKETSMKLTGTWKIQSLFAFVIRG